MKLIDLLVKELPKRGGFVVGANEAVQDADGTVKFFDAARLHFDHGYDEGRWCGFARSSFYCVRKNSFSTRIADDYKTAIITREQYEAALHQPVWDGEGLPPVGCECEGLYDISDDQWLKVRIIAHDGDKVIGRWLEGSGEGALFEYTVSWSFRRIRTEAQRTREEVIKQLAQSLSANYSVSPGQVTQLYEDIAAGKIPGVKLDI